MEDGKAIQSLPSRSFCDVSRPSRIETTVLGRDSNNCVWVTVEMYEETNKIVEWTPESDVLDWVECQLKHPSLWQAIMKFMPSALFVIPESLVRPRVLGWNPADSIPCPRTRPRFLRATRFGGYSFSDLDSSVTDASEAQSPSV